MNPQASAEPLTSRVTAATSLGSCRTSTDDSNAICQSGPQADYLQHLKFNRVLGKRLHNVFLVFWFVYLLKQKQDI